MSDRVKIVALLTLPWILVWTGLGVYLIWGTHALVTAVVVVAVGAVGSVFAGLVIDDQRWRWKP